jgi:hypothetical protein
MCDDIIQTLLHHLDPLKITHFFSAHEVKRKHHSITQEALDDHKSMDRQIIAQKLLMKYCMYFFCLRTLPLDY